MDQVGTGRPGGSDEGRLRLLRGATPPLPGRESPIWCSTPTRIMRLTTSTLSVHTLLSEDRVNLEAIYAAPFHNGRSTGPADGMRKSFEEINAVLDRCHKTGVPVFEGETQWLRDDLAAGPSPATEDLIPRALANEGRPLYGRHRRSHQRKSCAGACSRDA